MTVTRRTGLILGAGALAAPYLLRPAPAAAKAGMKGASRPGHMRFPHGEFEVTTIYDGAVQLGGPHPIFGEDPLPDDVAELMAAHNMPSGKMEIGFTTTLVNTGNELILFDTGNDPSQRATAGMTVDHMAQAGYAPEDVDVVVLTHFHGDHIGGMMRDGKPTFPNARYVTSRAEFDHWMAADNANVQAKVAPLAEKFTFLEDGQDVVSGVTQVAAHGHTPGHATYHVESGGRRVLVTADTANHFIASLERPDWHVRFDMDKEAAAASRRKIFGMVAADGIPFIGYHMPYPAVGLVTQNGSGGFTYHPASYKVFLED